MEPGALLLLEDDQALALDPSGEGMVAFDPDTGEGAECCCGQCAPRSTCCQGGDGVPGDPICGNGLPSSQRGGCFPTIRTGASSCNHFHGPVSYRFSGRVQTSYPTAQTVYQGGGATNQVLRRVFAPISFDIELAKEGLVLPNDAAVVASQMKVQGGLGVFTCQDYSFTANGNSTLQGQNGMNLPTLYPLFGAQMILEDVKLADYTTGNDGKNGSPAYTTAGEIRAMVLATFVNAWQYRSVDAAHTIWPPLTYQAKSGFNQVWNNGYFPGSSALQFRDDGVWQVSLAIYHVSQRLTGEIKVPGHVVGGIEPVISVGGFKKHASPYCAVSSFGPLMNGDTQWHYISASETSQTPQYSRGPSATVRGFVNSCGCVNRVCGTVDAALKFVKQPFSFIPPTTPAVEAPQDYEIKFDVTWLGTSKCDASKSDSSSAGTCDEPKAFDCAAFLLAFIFGDSAADYNGDGFVNGDDYDAMTRDHPECQTSTGVIGSLNSRARSLRPLNRRAVRGALRAADLLGAV